MDKWDWLLASATVGCLIMAICGSATDVSSCGTLASAGYYELTADMNSNNSCITIAASDVNLDCNGYLINYSRHGVGYGIAMSNKNNITIRGCNVIQLATLPPQYVTGINSTGLDFDGVDDCAATTASGTFNNQSQLSITGWIYMRGAGSSGSLLFDKNQDFYAFVPSSAATTLRFRLANSTTSTTLDTTAGTLINGWHSFAMTYNSSGTNNMKIYLDGTLNSSANLTGYTRTTADTVNIGCRGSSYIFNGVIDQLAVYNRTLGAAEILANNDTNNITDTTNLIGFWQFNEGSGTTAIDGSLYSNNGTLSGTGYASDAYGVYAWAGMTNSTVSNNTIMTAGSGSFAIYYYLYYASSASKTNNNISSNYIRVSGSSGHGIYLNGYQSGAEIQNITVHDNVITVPAGTQNTNFGIWLKYVKSADIFRNTYTGTVYGSSGIYAAGWIANVTIRNNTITSTYTGTNNPGIRLAECNNVSVYDNTIRWSGTTYAGGNIMIIPSAALNSSNIDIYNNTIIIGTGSGDHTGILFRNLLSGTKTENVSLWNNNFTTESTSAYNRYAVMFDSSLGIINNVTFWNSSIQGIYYAHINMSRNVNATFLNITGLNKSAIIFSTYAGGLNSSITVQWYARANVTNTSNDNIPATVNFTTGMETYEETANLTAYYAVTEFIANGTFTYSGGCSSQANLTCYPLTATASAAGYATNASVFNITQQTTLLLNLAAAAVVAPCAVELLFPILDGESIRFAVRICGVIMLL